jgi:hypothetical protein
MIKRKLVVESTDEEETKKKTQPGFQKNLTTPTPIIPFI